MGSYIPRVCPGLCGTCCGISQPQGRGSTVVFHVNPNHKFSDTQVIWEEDVHRYRFPYGKGYPVVFSVSERFIGTRVAFQSAGLHHRTSPEAGRGVPFVSFAGGHTPETYIGRSRSPNGPGARHASGRAAIAGSTEYLFPHWLHRGKWVTIGDPCSLVPLDSKGPSSDFRRVPGGSS